MEAKCSGCGDYFRKSDLYEGECDGCATGWDDVG